MVCTRRTSDAPQDRGRRVGPTSLPRRPPTSAEGAAGRPASVASTVARPPQTGAGATYRPSAPRARRTYANPPMTCRLPRFRQKPDRHVGRRCFTVAWIRACSTKSRAFEAMMPSAGTPQPDSGHATSGSCAERARPQTSGSPPLSPFVALAHRRPRIRPGRCSSVPSESWSRNWSRLPTESVGISRASDSVIPGDSPGEYASLLRSPWLPGTVTVDFLQSLRVPADKAGGISGSDSTGNQPAGRRHLSDVVKTAADTCSRGQNHSGGLAGLTAVNPKCPHRKVRIACGRRACLLQHRDDVIVG